MGKEKVHGGKDLLKNQVLSSEWNTERVREDASGESEDGEDDGFYKFNILNLGTKHNNWPRNAHLPRECIFQLYFSLTVALVSRA